MTARQWTKWGTILTAVSIIVAIWLTYNDPSQESYEVSSHNQSGGITAGKLEIYQDGKPERYFDAAASQRLIEEIHKREMTRSKKFDSIVVSASIYAESQNFAKQVINSLVAVDKWNIVPEPIIVFDRDWETPPPPDTDIVFNVDHNYDYPNSLEVIVLDE